MRVAMPTGNTHGWGIAGNYLAEGIARLPQLPGVTLHSVAGHHFAPTFEEQWDRINIGYCFFESEIVAYRFIPEAARRWDYIVAGSSWCEYHLRIAGMDRTSTILQGIDPSVFSPVPPRPDDGRFIIFSGGKFEFRKGHDLVIAAMRIFMERHPDAWLACAWHNHWPASIRTMEQTGLIRFDYRDQPCEEFFPLVLRENGIPLDRVMLYPVLDNRQMRQAYAASDIGLFPNRCEGGNNMVMCEYMACGRPVIASSMTGHMDVVSESNALCLTHYEPVLAVAGGAPAGVWFAPSVDETVVLLEKAYNDRQLLRQLGNAAGQSMKGLSWEGAASKFHTIGRKLVGAGQAAFSAVAPTDTIEQAAALFEQGDYAGAERSFLRLLAVSPLDAGLHSNLGTVLDRLERYGEAVLHYEKALALRPGFVEARYNLANTLKRMGDTGRAIRELEKVVEAAPDFVEAWQNLALCRLDAEDRLGAVEALRQVLVVEPMCHKSRADLGEILLELGEYKGAVECFDAVLKFETDNAVVLNSKGIALQWLNDLAGAETCYLKILENDPINTLALNNMGAIMRSRALPQEAIQYFNRALSIDPNDAAIRFNRSLALLSIGDFTNGWPDYEYRFKRSEAVELRYTDLPCWAGEDLEGKSILIWCEQGYGDSIQFVRYAAALAERGGRVVLEAQDELIAPLLARAKGVSEVFVHGSKEVTADFQNPLLSLPAIMGNIPCPPLYLDIKSEEVVFWNNLLKSGQRPKVGIAWAGRPAHENDRNRSIPPHMFEPLAHCGEAQFVSLQFSPAAPLLKPVVVDMSSRVNNFIDSAALIAGLDLVVTIDSAVAHLAGALGVPVWILLPYNPDWRWLLNGDKSDWYASARLFRQKQPFQWQGVIAELVEELKIFLTTEKNA
ncbi:MAG TPA: tetratricopeptide repeat protein [Deltaproteobacteria bacterium]|nr:tetratricopeptide repeat protein [Deltaproteobacteria bacterium]HQB39684.1 tetratricopeptide repeat protein [Deltaproteobacteria bacterium]